MESKFSTHFSELKSLPWSKVLRLFLFWWATDFLELNPSENDGKTACRDIANPHYNVEHNNEVDFCSI